MNPIAFLCLILFIIPTLAVSATIDPQTLTIGTTWSGGTGSHAASATIDPQTITIDDAELGSTYTILFRVTNPGDVSETYSLVPSGGIQPWIELPVRNITIAPNSSHELNATITISNEFTNDFWWGGILIQNSLEEGVNLPITINIKNQPDLTREIVRYLVIIVIILTLLIIFRTRPKSKVRHFKFKQVILNDIIITKTTHK